MEKERTLLKRNCLRAPLLISLVQLTAHALHGHLHGPGPEQFRTPTIGFTIEGMDSSDVAEQLADGSALFLSHGDFYASGVTEALGIEQQGLVRAGCACYTNQEEVERLIMSVADLSN